MGVRRVWLFLLIEVASLPVLKEKHTLLYHYSLRSSHSVNNTYTFSAVALLDDTQIDSYSIRGDFRTPQQIWMLNIEENQWKAGSENLKRDLYLLNKFLDLQLKFFGHDPSDGHSLQWRNGCEVKMNSDDSVQPLNCINIIKYNGEESISYNWTLKKWSATQDSELEKEWNNKIESNAPVHKYEHCVNWLKKYLQSSSTETISTVPDVYVYVKKSQTESRRLTLTCLATGFYPKDLKMRVRRFTTSLPDHLLTSSGVRPNGDGTYRLRKSVDVQEEDTAGYNCYVEHSSLQEPIIIPWEGIHSDSSGDKGVIIGAVMVVVVLVAVVCGYVVYKQREKIVVGIRRITRNLLPSPQSIGEKKPLSPVPSQPEENSSLAGDSESGAASMENINETVSLTLNETVEEPCNYPQANDPLLQDLLVTSTP